MDQLWVLTLNNVSLIIELQNPLPLWNIWRCFSKPCLSTLLFFCMELFRAARVQPSTPLTHIRCLFLLLALHFHSDGRSSCTLSWMRGEADAEAEQKSALLYHPSLLTWRNGFYDSTFCSKLSFVLHLGVLLIFSTCQLMRHPTTEVLFFHYSG